jgi:hypothetical protein
VLKVHLFDGDVREAFDVDRLALALGDSAGPVDRPPEHLFEMRLALRSLLIAVLLQVRRPIFKAQARLRWQADERDALPCPRADVGR